MLGVLFVRMRGGTHDEEEKGERNKELNKENILRNYIYIYKELHYDYDKNECPLIHTNEDK